METKIVPTIVISKSAGTLFALIVRAEFGPVVNPRINISPLT